MRQIEDCRKKSDYELVELIMACIAMPLFKADSRNAFNNERQEGNFKENYQKTLKITPSKEDHYLVYKLKELPSKNLIVEYDIQLHPEMKDGAFLCMFEIDIK